MPDTVQLREPAGREARDAPEPRGGDQRAGNPCFPERMQGIHVHHSTPLSRLLTITSAIPSRESAMKTLATPTGVVSPD